MRKMQLTRFGIFAAVAAAHAALLAFYVFHIETTVQEPPPPITVMKLTDLREQPPEPPKPPPPDTPRQTTTESIAQTMVETDELPPDLPVEPVAAAVIESVQAEVFLPMHKISVRPVFAEREILRSLVYPPIALKAGVEGNVVLELFISSAGIVQNISIMKEDPPGKGFGEAAVKAFQGRVCEPAQANGQPVAVRYRYPVRFTIK